MNTVLQSRQVPVRAEYDVVVCGGGPSGIIAALAASRGGARTAIIERYGFFGGMATAALVAPISVFNYNGRRIIDGIPWEFITRLTEIGGAREEKPLGNITFSPEKYKLIAQRMLVEAGVQIYFHSYLSDCNLSGTIIKHVIVENKDGAEAIGGKVFVDATGDADLAVRAGVPLQPASKKLQPASLIFMLGGVDTEDLPMIRHCKQGVNYLDVEVRKKFEELRKENPDIPVFGGPWYCGILEKGIVLVNMTRIDADMTSNREQTAAECAMREEATLFATLLKMTVPAFSNSFLLETAPQTGVRETRRILGAYTLTGEDYLNAVDFPDSVSRGCHPVDIHSGDTTSQRCQFLKEAAFVPYRCLYSPDFPNYLVAGRAFSADSVASASVRVQASCMGLGQAAGAAAALSVRGGTGVGEIDTDKLRKILISYGTNLSR
ncbi:MAG: FAD-dependent oxidoreductase [Bacteroidales bacterium]|jgi:hypothetical protein|nr:FAD-dependent oxidoreductase [Bacteroidales bacterium]MCI2144845.1 FAD-dependent oxidoreductase [Bacteroidales bacterium]